MKITNKHILFWGGVFSNFEHTPFKVGNNTFPTNEHYFMYCKAKFFNDPDAAEKILKAKTPKEAKKLGRSVKNFNAEQWKIVCKHYMKEGLHYKFNSTPELVKTITKYPTKLKFVECSPYDKIWGIGLSEDDPWADDESQWLGTNWLGECLDEVRDNIILLT